MLRYDTVPSVKALSLQVLTSKLCLFGELPFDKTAKTKQFQLFGLPSLEVKA